MSEISQSNNTRNQLFSAYDFSKIFLFNNIYRTVNIAASGADVVISAGQIIGSVAGVAEIYASATANIQLIGIATEDIVITDGTNADILICIGGKVAEEKIVLDGSDTLATVVALKTIRERIEGDTVGIYLETTDELTADDNV